MRLFLGVFLVLAACSQPVADSTADDASATDVAVVFDAKDVAVADADAVSDAKDVVLDDADVVPDAKDVVFADADVALDAKDVAFADEIGTADVPDAILDAADVPDMLSDVPDDVLADIAVDVTVVSTKAGCSDGTREGFGDAQIFPTIAACGGAWDQPGIFNMPAKCNREGGNDGLNAAGVGCTVSDLCATGWHVCYGKDDVVFRNADGCAGVMTGATPPVFFTTQMSSTGSFMCASGANATNDLFGCGNLGCDFTSNPTVKTMCAPLGLSSHDLCKGLRNDKGCGDWCNHLGKYPGAPNSWDCGSDGDKEALNVVKSHPEQQGGVLCCLD